MFKILKLSPMQYAFFFYFCISPHLLYHPLPHYPLVTNKLLPGSLSFCFSVVCLVFLLLSVVYPTYERSRRVLTFSCLTYSIK